MGEGRIYKVVFHNRDEVFEIYARSVSQGSLFGFVEVEDIVFGETSKVVVDPSEESLKLKFKGVRRTYIPLHAVVRIDEVEREGTARITKRAEGEGTLTPFPTPIVPEPPKKR